MIRKKTFTVLPYWLERWLRDRWGLIPQHRIPEAGATMYPWPLTDEPPEDGGDGCVEVLDVDDVGVRYRTPSGHTFTRSRRGFMKNYSRVNPDDRR